MAKVMTRDMTKGNPLPIILRFCLPLLFGNLFQQLYNVVDSVVVGRTVGAAALAAVGSTGALNFLIIGFTVGMTTGFGIPVAQSFGAGDTSEMRRYAANAAYLSVAVVVVVTTLTMIFTRNLLELMGTPADILEQARDYIIVIFGGVAATVLYNLLASVLRALGDSKTPLYFLILASLINVALDIILIAGLGYGVGAAGLATVVSQGVSGLCCLIYIRRSFPILRFQKDELRFSSKHSLRLLSIGIPMALQFSITAVGSVVLQAAVNSLGTITVAAVTTASRISGITFQPFDTLGATMATYCGQNLGARQLARVRKGVSLAVRIMLVYCAFAMLLLWFGGSPLSQLFLKADADTPLIIDNIVYFLRVLVPFYPALGLLMILRCSVQGMGYSFLPMFAGVFELVARAGMAFFFVGSMGYLAICLASPFAWIAACILLIPVYFYVINKLKKNYVN